MKQFRFMCASCSRSQTNQTAHQYCNYCDHDWRLLRKLAAAMRAAKPERARECDVELAARAWVYVCEREFPQHLQAARNLLAECSTHIQLNFGDVPKVTPEELSLPTREDWDDDVPF